MLDKYIQDTLESYYRKIDSEIEKFLKDKYDQLPPISEIQEKGKLIVTEEPFIENSRIFLPKVIFEWEGKKVIEIGGN